MSRAQRSAMGFAYYAYGLTYRSELRLPELLSVSAQPEIEISIGTVDQKPRGGNANAMAVEIGVDATWLSHPSVGAFRVCNGTSIAVEPAAGVDAKLLRLCLLGPALGTLLRQRGRLTLHGSAVDIDGAAVVFLGDSCAGKSTLAAAFHNRGCRLLADDITVMDATRRHPLVFPGFPRVKLDDRAAASTMRNPGAGLVSGKRYFPAERGFAAEPIRLGRVFVLADADVCAVDGLQPHEGLLELLRHSYGARSLQAVNRESHFQQCATVASRVPLRRLSRKMELAELPALTRLIENDLGKAN